MNFIVYVKYKNSVTSFQNFVNKINLKINGSAKVRQTINGQWTEMPFQYSIILFANILLLSSYHRDESRGGD